MNDVGYLGNPNVKRDGVVNPWTQEEILEYKSVWMIQFTLRENIVKLYHLMRVL